MILSHYGKGSGQSQYGRYGRGQLHSRGNVWQLPAHVSGGQKTERGECWYSTFSDSSVTPLKTPVQEMLTPTVKVSL